MFASFYRFELRYRLRQPAVYIFSVIFALLTFGAMTSDAVVIGGGAGQTAINSPYVITQMLSIMSVLAVILVTAFVSTAVTRDFEMGSDALFFTKPIRKLDFLAGRFLGAVTVAMVVMVAAALGMALGSVMPWLDAERMVEGSAAPYLQTLSIFVLPNLVVMGSFFFALATLTRRVLPAYVGVIAFFVIFSVSNSFISDLDNDTIAALTDPFGSTSLEISTRYWTVTERNSSLMPMSGLLMLNRAVWLGLAGLCFAFTVRRFSFEPRSKRGKADAAQAEPARVDTPLVVVQPHRSWGTAASQLWHQVRVELSWVLRSLPFIVLLLFGVAVVVGSVLGTIDNFFGTAVYPVTHIMVRIVDAAFDVFVIIVITFYSGELVHRERQLRMHEVHDALPVSEVVPLISKIFALIVAVFVLLGVAATTAIAIQVSYGYTTLELPLYIQGLWGISLSKWALVCVLAIFFQVLVNHKYLGFLLMVLFFVSKAVLPLLDLQHGLYQYGWIPETPYSDMNGYGHFITSATWYQLYWSLFALGLVLVAKLLWVRGTDARLRLRLREARRRASAVHTVALAVLAGAVFVVGGVILHNTTVLSRFRTSDDEEAAAARYEEQYSDTWEHALQPRVKAVDVAVDIHPASRKVDISGTMKLVNTHDAAIEQLFVTVPVAIDVESLDVPNGTQVEHDEELGIRIFQLDPALAPGESLALGLSLHFSEEGFMNDGSAKQVVANGTFFNSGFMPYIGYQRGRELTDPNERRKRGLAERERMRPPTDMAARANTYLGSEGDWIDFAATVSTSADQIALAPGYLVKQWEADGRSYFRYEMDAPILDFYAFLSADYEVVRDQWNDVTIEIYHHAPHDMNVQRMVEAIQKSLDYFTTNFSDYQHRQMRIVEFPRYASFAQSFPNTVPYSESIGFIANLSDDEDIDYVFYVTAHEVAHQWWAHQVIGGNVQGSTMLSETLSQYSALMVMEKEYGRAKMKKFLAYELDRYLQGRGGETEQEQPLALVENQQYIHYNKGSMVMYALREVMGEAELNAVLSQFIADVGFQQAPFTTSLELVERLRAAMPDKYAYLIEDLFETITLYDNRALAATATSIGEDRWRVDLSLESHKLRADDKGVEQPMEMADWIEIGIYADDEDAEPLYEQWHQITQERTQLSIEVNGRPARAGIDPRVLFVDREPDDNVQDVEIDD